jgi:hypothetical protein
MEIDFDGINWMWLAQGRVYSEWFHSSNQQKNLRPSFPSPPNDTYPMYSYMYIDLLFASKKETS